MVNASAGFCPPVIYKGIQHTGLIKYVKDKSNHPFCSTNWLRIRDACHSKECTFFADSSRLNSKQRYSKCTNAHSHINPRRVPKLYPKKSTNQAGMASTSDVDANTTEKSNTNRPSSTNSSYNTNTNGTSNAQQPSDSIQPSDDDAITKLIFENDEILQRRIINMNNSLDVHEPLECPELQIAASVLKLRGTNAFKLEDQKVMAHYGSITCVWQIFSYKEKLTLRIHASTGYSISLYPTPVYLLSAKQCFRLKLCDQRVPAGQYWVMYLERFSVSD